MAEPKNENRRAGKWIVVAFLVFGGLWLTGRLPWSFTKSVEIDRAVYFRVKVDLAYKGQPIQFDIVAGCGATVTRHYKDGSSSREGSVLVPTVYGLRMPDNKAVVLPVPIACRGETTENGGVPEDFIPFVAVLDNADKPIAGMGYATEDAYASRLSVLTIPKTLVATATRAEFDAWRATEAVKNIVKPSMLRFDIGKGTGGKPWRSGDWYFGEVCEGVLALDVPPDKRAEVQKEWPEPVPQYWESVHAGYFYENHPFNPSTPARPQSRNWQLTLQFGLQRNYADGMAYTVAGRTETGRPKRGQMRHYDMYKKPEVYPIFAQITANKTTADNWYTDEMIADPEGVVSQVVRIEEDLKGFFACSSGNFSKDYPPPSRPEPRKHRWIVNNVEVRKTAGLRDITKIVERHERVYWANSLHMVQGEMGGL